MDQCNNIPITWVVTAVKQKEAGSQSPLRPVLPWLAQARTVAPWITWLFFSFNVISSDLMETPSSCWVPSMSGSISKYGVSEGRLVVFLPVITWPPHTAHPSAAHSLKSEDRKGCWGKNILIEGSLLHLRKTEEYKDICQFL